MTNATRMLSGIGLFVLFTIVYRIINFVQLYTRSSDLRKYLHSTSGKPAWALVTGSTAGIGKALAQELAASGFNIVLHGRNITKLESVKAELQKAHPTREFRVLVINAATCYMEPETWIEEVLDLVQDINLTVLVNNAGGATQPSYATLDVYDSGRILDVVNLNAVFPTLLTSILIPVLLRNKPGLIINIGSLSDNGLPLLSFYAASKTFGSALSLSVAREMQLENREVEVIMHRLGIVVGAGDNKHVEPYFWGPTADVMAKAILACTGCGRKSVVPYWTHGLQQLAMERLPDWLADKITIFFMSGYRDEERASKKH